MKSRVYGMFHDEPSGERVHPDGGPVAHVLMDGETGDIGVCFHFEDVNLAMGSDVAYRLGRDLQDAARAMEWVRRLLDALGRDDVEGLLPQTFLQQVRDRQARERAQGGHER